MNEIPHAGVIFTAQELLAALVAERLELMINKLVERGLSRVALYGSAKHTDWLERHIDGMRHIPIRYYVSWGDSRMPVGSHRNGVPVVSVGDPRLTSDIDCLLIGDDRHESKLFDLACRHLPPRIMIHRLYQRLPIGLDPIPTPHVAEAKSPTVVSTPAIARSAGATAARDLMAGLVAGTAQPL
ncbi:MAG: hypothetical protein AAGI30_14130 [Planctomycetota bacterium]